MKPERSVLRYFGGKWALSPWILEHMPPHKLYVEPFGGGCSVLMRKPRSYGEVYNDLDGEVVNVFRTIRDNGSALARLLAATPWAREEFDLPRGEDLPALERARRTIARSFMGYGGNGIVAETGFKADSTAGKHAAQCWAEYHHSIAAFQERLMGVVIENRDAKEVMAQHDGEQTLFFVDPPYVHETRNEKHGYRFEMTDTEHEQLCDFLKQLKGMVILCGYHNPIYDRLGWQTVEREALADGARARTEVLWLNPACVNAQAQQKLF